MTEAAPRALEPPFTAEHEELRTSIRSFIESECAPYAEEWEEARFFPDELFAKFAANGLLGLKYPEELGGRGGGFVDEAVLVEELSRCGSGGVAAGIGAHVNIATPPIFKFGTEDQKQRYLVPSIAGEKIAGLAITEPDAGSDVAGIRTKASRVDGGWLVNGSKMFITNGVRADYLVTAVKTTDEGGHHGISFLIVEAGEGVSASKIEKLGWHASDTGLIAFDDVYVPEENLLGRENEGFYLIMANFQWERLVMALGAVAGMQRLFDVTLPHCSGQAVRHRMAEMATTIEVGRALSYHALRLFVSGQDATKEVTMAKLATQRAAFDVADKCFQIVGDPGSEIGRAMRDARLGPIGGGTDEIMREILGRSLGL